MKGEVKQSDGDEQIRKGIKEIEALFRALEQDKTLPTFGEFFISCLQMGNSESVNLKAMFPALHKKLIKWFEEHALPIKEMREQE